ncbi:hypothetical protein DID99_35650 [Burkholderia sp. Bp8986]|nr:hypothetical protein DID99_35650 [Burkholderia sp. Bp8986]
MLWIKFLLIVLFIMISLAPITSFFTSVGSGLQFCLIATAVATLPSVGVGSNVQPMMMAAEAIVANSLFSTRFPDEPYMNARPAPPNAVNRFLSNVTLFDALKLTLARG